MFSFIEILNMIVKSASFLLFLMCRYLQILMFFKIVYFIHISLTRVTIKNKFTVLPKKFTRSLNFSKIEI